jgi:hypothetical protein
MFSEDAALATVALARGVGVEDAAAKQAPPVATASAAAIVIIQKRGLEFINNFFHLQNGLAP